MRRILRALSLTAVAGVLLSQPGLAQRRGGGFRGGGARGGGFRGGGIRASARPNVTMRPGGGFGGARPAIAQRPAVRPGAGTINRGNAIANGNRTRIANRPPANVGDININRDVNWDNDYDGCCYRAPGYGAAAAAAGYWAGAATAAAVGSTVYTVPSSCVSTVVNGITYMQCGSTWYKPTFEGTTTGYVVVSPP